MPTFAQVVKSKAYQGLPLKDAKTKFYKDVVIPSKKPESEKIAFHKKFFPEDYANLSADESITSVDPVDVLDAQVEKVAKTIEPTPEELARDMNKGGMHKWGWDFPRMMAAEYARWYKPSQLAPAVVGAKLIEPVAAPVLKYGFSKLPKNVQEFLMRNLTVGKGQPLEYQDLKRKTEMARIAGTEEAEKVGVALSTAPKDMEYVTQSGKIVKIKKGQPLTKDQQQYIGRIFRKEVDLGGKKSTLGQDPALTEKIAKHTEVEATFNPKVQQLQSDLKDLNSALNDKELLAQQLVGKEFRTKIGTVEKASEVVTGKPVELATKPIVPVEGRNIPQSIFPEGEVTRTIPEINKAPSTNKYVNIDRKKLLQQRNKTAYKLQKELEDIQTMVKAQYSVFDQNFTEQIRNHPKYKELSAIANEGRDVMDKWSKELVKTGIPGKEAQRTIEQNVGEYMARMYPKYVGKRIPGGKIADLRLRLDGLKHRKDLSQSVIDTMIKEPALPTAIRVKQISATVANEKMFKTIASNPEWTATKDLTGKMMQMPDTPTFGSLRGKFVVPEIGQDIVAVEKINNQALEVYKKAIQAWKYGKVVLNPATHVRNMIANTILLDLSGVSHIRQLQLTPRVMKDYLSKGKYYKLAREYGAIGSEFLGDEIKALENHYLSNPDKGNLDRIMDMARRPVKNLGSLYQAEEQVAKMIKFTDMLERGATPEIAAREAQKWLFNYNEIPEFMKFFKQVAPFSTFTYKSVPRIAEAVIKNPLRVYKYYALFNSFNDASRKYQGMSPAEFARSKDALPEWMLKDIGGMPANLLMPYTDKSGRQQWLNLEYILPLGMSPEILEQGVKGVVTNPFLTTLADLLKNSDFKGNPIVPVGATSSEANGAALNYIYRQLAPSLAPGLFHVKGEQKGETIWKGGYSWEKLVNSFYNRPDYLNRVRDLPTTILDTLAGIKITPIDTTEQEFWKMKEKQNIIEELTKQAYKFSHPAISEKTRAKEVEKIFKKMQNIMKEK